jgi:hypothetical protein
VLDTIRAVAPREPILTILAPSLSRTNPVLGIHTGRALTATTELSYLAALRERIKAICHRPRSALPTSAQTSEDDPTGQRSQAPASSVSGREVPFRRARRPSRSPLGFPPTSPLQDHPYTRGDLQTTHLA